jgi:hypothetical protein
MTKPPAQEEFRAELLVISLVAWRLDADMLENVHIVGLRPLGVVQHTPGSPCQMPEDLETKQSVGSGNFSRRIRSVLLSHRHAFFQTRRQYARDARHPPHLKVRSGPSLCPDSKCIGVCYRDIGRMQRVG